MPGSGFDVNHHFRVVGLLTSLSGGRGHPKVSTQVHEHVFGPSGPAPRHLQRKYIIIITASLTTSDSRTVVLQPSAHIQSL